MEDLSAIWMVTSSKYVTRLLSGKSSDLMKTSVTARPPDKTRSRSLYLQNVTLALKIRAACYYLCSIWLLSSLYKSSICLCHRQNVGSLATICWRKCRKSFHLVTIIIMKMPLFQQSSITPWTFSKKHWSITWIRRTVVTLCNSDVSAWIWCIKSQNASKMRMRLPEWYPVSVIWEHICSREE